MASLSRNPLQGAFGFRKVLSSLLFLFFSIVVPAEGLTPLEARRIQEEIARGELQVAETELESRLLQDASDFSAHLLLGIIRQKQGRPEDALKQFHISHDLRPRDASPYVDMGNVFADTGHFDAAVEQFENAIRVDATNTSARRNLGMLCLQRRQTHEGMNQLEQVVHQDPADAESWFALFQAELSIHDFTAARETAKRIGGLTGASSELFRSVAALQASSGDYQGSIPNLQRALEADPTSSDTKYNLALAWLRNHQAVKAIPLLLSLRDMHPGGEVENLLGEAYEQENRPVEAVRAYQAAAEMEPLNEDYTYDYIDELLTHKNFDAALLVAQAAVGNFPASLRMQLARVAAHYGLGNTQLASTELRDACDRFPDSSLALYLRSVIAEAEGAPDATLMEQTHSYLERHPEDSTAWLVLGKMQARPEPQQALLSLSRSLELKETTAEAHFEAARIYGDAHNWSKAAVHAKRAVELNPRLSEAWYRLALASYRTGNKSMGDAAMQRFKTQHAADQNRSKVATFLYTLR